MQDIQSIIGSGAGGEGLFRGGGDSRLRPHHRHQAHGHHDLKCPRCHSLNTKFCYYNNYNLSQPRHFCKSCRRYWTKGGVLRNIPVGGGCRKTKRSKPKSNNSNPSPDAAAPPGELKSSISQKSSSDSSAAVNTTATETTGIVTTEVSDSAPTLLNFQSSSSASMFNNFQSSSPNRGFDPQTLDPSSADNNMFSEIDKFTSLMTSSTGNFPLPFTLAGDTSSFRQHQENTEEVVENPNSNRQQWIHEIGSTGFMDQMTEIELSGLKYRRSNGGLATEDWQGGEEEALFDLTGAVDQSYWSETQWDNHDDDHHLNYLP